MASTARTKIIIALTGVVAATALGIALAHRMLRENVRTITGTVTRIDLDTRTASIEFVHRKTGRTLHVDGIVPPDCDIRIDGRPARLSDLRIGEQITVQGTIHRDTTISADWVRVTRAAGSEPAPQRLTLPAPDP